MLNPDSQTESGASESPSESGLPRGSSDVVVQKVCPTKRAGAILANSWVQIGDVRIRFKILWTAWAVRGRAGDLLQIQYRPHVLRPSRLA